MCRHPSYPRTTFNIECSMFLVQYSLPPIRAFLIYILFLGRCSAITFINLCNLLTIIFLLSKALAHYPLFRFRQQQKLLWNPILKKTFVNRPEERVRLALVHYFTENEILSPHRIAFESPVKSRHSKHTVRTDLICYDSEFNPLLLGECKAPDIKLDEKAAIQIARYNQQVDAPYLLVSNGMVDFWFQQQGGQVQPLKQVPETFAGGEAPDKDFIYWQERGFLGEMLPQNIRTYANQLCNQWFSKTAQPVKYLSFDGFSPELSLGHYYRIFAFQPNIKVAVSLSANPFGGTRLNGVLNQNGANTAFLSASLDLLARSESPNTELHSSQGQHTFDLAQKAGFTIGMPHQELAKSIQTLLLNHV